MNVNYNTQEINNVLKAVGNGEIDMFANNENAIRTCLPIIYNRK